VYLVFFVVTESGRANKKAKKTKQKRASTKIERREGKGEGTNGRGKGRRANMFYCAFLKGCEKSSKHVCSGVPAKVASGT